MKKISDYFGTKTAIKCDNNQQWEKLKELCGKRLHENYTFDLNLNYFTLDEIGNGFGEAFIHKPLYQILPYSDFVSDVPELVGVEMEVSDDGKCWSKRLVYGCFENKYVYESFIGGMLLAKHARPITKKVLTATLQELAEMLNVDEIQLK